MLKKHRESLDRKNVHLVSFLSFIFGLTDAFFVYVLSSYFERVMGSDNVGGFYLAAYASMFALLWWLQKIMRRIGGSVRSFFLFMVLSIFLSAILSVLSPGWVAASVLVLLIILANLAWVALDVVLEGFSEDGATGGVRGLHLTIMNAGILLAPLISTRVLETYGYEGIFSGVTIGYAILLSIAVVFLRDGRDVSSAKMEARQAWKKMFREKDLFRIFYVSFALEFFYAIMVIYTPIHLRSVGVSWNDIGILYTVMLLPFIFLQYPVGVLADKRFGEKELLAVFAGVGAVSVFLMGLFGNSESLILWGTLLFLSRIGAAGVEVLRDSYFYKQVDGDDDDLIAFFRIARPTANIIGAVMTIPFLFIFPLQAIFFLPALALTSALWPISSLRDSR